MQKKPRQSTQSGEWPLIAALDAALAPTWHEARLAGRVRRHTGIVRDLAHQLSTLPDRPDLPATAAEARERWDAHLAQLAATPRAGLAAQTGAFVDTLLRRAARYSDHLFHCFDDPRIPASTNGLERFFGVSKSILRHALGCGSTTNSVVANLGAEPLLALHQMRGGTTLKEFHQRTPAEFTEVRKKIAFEEAPGIRRRSMVRHLDRHLVRLRCRWLDPGAAERDA